MYYGTERFTLYHGDNREILKQLPDNSIDSVVTDPPYELGFMGKKWDSTGIAYDVELWREVLRVLKPGGHLLAFSGSRTYHRMAVAIEDAGFDIRDQIMWIYGSGFPKSLDVSKALDKQQGVWRGRAGKPLVDEKRSFGQHYEPTPKGPPYTEDAKQWQGYGTALKPAHEPIVMARKPVTGTVAANVLEWGVGGLNIDGTRVGNQVMQKTPSNGEVISENRAMSGPNYGRIPAGEVTGRWPANVIHDGSDEVVELFPNTAPSNVRPPTGKPHLGRQTSVAQSGGTILDLTQRGHNDNGGSAARFFYCAKASKRDRNEGLDGFEAKFAPTMGDGIGMKEHNSSTATKKQNHHPTVKPTDLMAYLCRLVTPKGGTVLDPFMGSGSTGKAAMYEGFKFVGIEMTDEYLPIAKARIEFALNEESEKLL